jgi:hypothetical protein
VITWRQIYRGFDPSEESEMTRLSSVGLLLAACCIPSYAQSNPLDESLWLQPISYQEMRDMMERAREQAKSGQRGGPGSQSMEHGEMGGMKGMQGGEGAEAMTKPQQGGRPGSQPMEHGEMGEMGEMAGMKGMQGNGEKKKPSWRRGMRMRRTYLRFGPFPQEQSKPGGRPERHAENPAASSVVWLERPDSTIGSAMVKQRRSAIQAEYKADDGGWYRLFAYNDLGVRDNTRQKFFSYYTFMSHGEEADIKESEPLVRQGYFQGEPELELVQLYEDDEQRYRKYVGDKLRVGALFRGLPLAGARLTLTTEQGWSQTRTTDEFGEAAFILIKEDFHEDGVDRRNSELYLARVDHSAPIGGQYMGASYDTTRYVATLPFRVSPAKEDWQSQRIAYLIAMITIIGSAVAIAIRRRRKKKT